MRTFWLCLASMAMACAAFGSDAPDVKVGDWVKMKTTQTATAVQLTGNLLELPKLSLPLTTLTRVTEIGGGRLVFFDVKRATRIPGKDQPDVVSNDMSILLSYLNSTDSRRYREAEWDGVKVEVLEEGERTVSVNGVTFENVFYQKVKTTEPGSENVIEVWDDGRAPFAMLAVGGTGVLKQVTTTMTTTPQGAMEIVETTERVAYGRAGDPIPEVAD